MLEAVTSFSPSYSEPNPGIHTSHVVIQWNKPLLLLPLTILEVPVWVQVYASTHCQNYHVIMICTRKFSVMQQEEIVLINIYSLKQYLQIFNINYSVCTVTLSLLFWQNSVFRSRPNWGKYCIETLCTWLVTQTVSCLIGTFQQLRAHHLLHRYHCLSLVCNWYRHHLIRCFYNIHCWVSFDTQAAQCLKYPVVQFWD